MRRGNHDNCLVSRAPCASYELILSSFFANSFASELSYDGTEDTEATDEKIGAILTAPDRVKTMGRPFWALFFFTPVSRVKPLSPEIWSPPR